MTNITKAAQDALEVTLYECVACKHLHQHKVSQCDCLENHDNEYREWIAHPKYTSSAALQDKAGEVILSGWIEVVGNAPPKLDWSEPETTKTNAPEGASELAKARGKSSVNTGLGLASLHSTCSHVFALDPRSSIRMCNLCGTVERTRAAQPAPAVPDRDVLTVNLLRHTSLTKTQARALIAHWLDGAVPDAALFKKASPVVPDGFALVPVEPTDEMEAEAENHYESSGSPFPDWKAAYRAMLAASKQKGGQ